ncbi:MAG: SMI1/KNR4 family protein [Lachnospiraceae bacterium]|nr:SMI1/KNR4 family protein [Lachnospiraceae bacterium]
MSFVITLQSQDEFIGSNGRTKKQIELAEYELGVKFANDYCEYLEVIGLASYDGHELTGITDDARLNVVAVTKEYRKLYGHYTDFWYVIEDVGLDGIVVWQNSFGDVYKASFDSNPLKIADSLTEYIQQY